MYFPLTLRSVYRLPAGSQAVPQWNELNFPQLKGMLTPLASLLSVCTLEDSGCSAPPVLTPVSDFSKLGAGERGLEMDIYPVGTVLRHNWLRWKPGGPAGLSLVGV